MGLQINLVKLLGLPDAVICPRCKKNIPTCLDDYDIEMDNFNPSPATIKVFQACLICDHSWYAYFKLTATPVPSSL